MSLKKCVLPSYGGTQSRQGDDHAVAACAGSDGVVCGTDSQGAGSLIRYQFADRCSQVNRGTASQMDAVPALPPVIALNVS